MIETLYLFYVYLKFHSHDTTVSLVNLSFSSSQPLRIAKKILPLVSMYSHFTDLPPPCWHVI